jgi:acyl carrier protein
MSDREQIVEKLLTILKDDTSIARELPEMDQDTSLPKALGLDSMDLVSLGMAIEDAFRIRIDSDELVGQDLTLGRLVSLIESSQAAPRGEALPAD